MMTVYLSDGKIMLTVSKDLRFFSTDLSVKEAVALSNALLTKVGDIQDDVVQNPPSTISIP